MKQANNETKRRWSFEYNLHRIFHSNNLSNQAISLKKGKIVNSVASADNCRRSFLFRTGSDCDRAFAFVFAFPLSFANNNSQIDTNLYSE